MKAAKLYDSDVGYSNYPLTNGTCMAGSAFNTIGQEKTTLMQIKPQGYLNSTAYTTLTSKQKSKGCLGQITVTFLDNKGDAVKDADGYDMKYYWKHTYLKSGGWQDDAHWYQTRGAEDITITSLNDVDVPVGQGLWFKVLSGWNSDFNFSAPGQALVTADTVALADGTTPVIVPISKDCKLTDFIPKGYLESTIYTTMTSKQKSKGCLGQITVTFLDEKGDACKDADGYDMKYYWKHTYLKSGGWQSDAHWYQTRGAEDVTITSETAPTIKMGQGLWAKVLSGWNSDFYMEGPGLED